jgi:hypothetical protein
VCDAGQVNIRYLSPPISGMRIGYTRVSTVAQTLHQQHDALKAAGVSKIYSDTLSGARDDRPGLAALMDHIRAGDTVVVWKLVVGTNFPRPAPPAR